MEPLKERDMDVLKYVHTGAWTNGEQPVTAADIESYKVWFQTRLPDIDQGAKESMPPMNSYVKPESGEQALWLSLIEESVRDALGQGYMAKQPSQNNPQLTNQQDALRWIADDDFEETCQLVGLDVEFMRKKVKLEQAT